MINNQIRRKLKIITSNKKYKVLNNSLYSDAVLQQELSIIVDKNSPNLLMVLNGLNDIILDSTILKKASSVVVVILNGAKDINSFETSIFSLGFMKSHFYYGVDNYGEENHFLLLYEKLNDGVLDEFPLEYLLKERDLHMDMARESGIRSAGHVIRYYVAGKYVQDEAIVLDCACGYGYGSNILYKTTTAREVIGIDLSENSIRYANKVYSNAHVSFVVENAQELSSLSDDSIDFITSFETLEHIPDPMAFLRRANSLLKDNGYIMISVPNAWVDETGNDPNPFHLHVYDSKKIESQLSQFFQIRKCWSLTMSGFWEMGSMQFSEPFLYEHETLADIHRKAECILVLAQKVKSGSAIDERGITRRSLEYDWYNFISDKLTEMKCIVLQEHTAYSNRVQDLEKEINIKNEQLLQIEQSRCCKVIKKIKDLLNF